MFVDLGGVDGMIHISELSWEELSATDVVQLGDVEVFIKGLTGYKQSFIGL